MNIDGTNYSYRSLIVAVFLSLVSYKLARTFYDVLLGPLSRIPGPRLAAATRLVFAYQRVRGNGEQWILELHQKYGGVVRIAPQEVSFSTGNNWKSIYGYSPGKNTAAMAKDPKYYFHDLDDSHLVVVSDGDHLRHRKRLLPAFSDKAVAKQEPMIQQYIDQLIANLHRSSKEGIVDMVRSYNFTTFDIMADLLFGEPLGCLKNSEYSDWISQVFAMLPIFTFVIEINQIPMLRKSIEAILPASLKKKKEAHYQHTNERVNKRLSSDTSRPDIMGLLQSENSKGIDRLSLDEIHADARILMLAGTETTATVLSGLTYFLLTNPDKLKRLTNEIRSTFTASEEINSLSTSKLTYLSCCIQEALRVYPAIPFGLSRVVGKGGIEMDGYFIPEKTSVHEHMYSVYHNEDNFTRAKEFLPERWFKEDLSPEFKNDKRLCLQPFSVGPRNCLGMPLAYLELRLIMAHVLYNFDMSIHSDSINWTKQKTFCLWEKHPLNVTLTAVV